MSSYYLSIIKDSDIEKAREKAENRIAGYRRLAESMRIVAAAFDGAYVTKKIEEKVAAIVPGAKRVYLSTRTYTDAVELTICYSDDYSMDSRDEFNICTRKNRRLDGAALLKSAASHEADAMHWERLLSRLDMNVERYNSIAKEYAKIYSDIDVFFDDLPHADYEERRRAEESISPDRFLEILSA